MYAYIISTVYWNLFYYPMKFLFKERRLLKNKTWKTKGIWWGISKFLLYFTAAILLFLSFFFPFPFFPVFPLPTFHGPGSLGVLFVFLCVAFSSSSPGWGWKHSPEGLWGYLVKENPQRSKNTLCVANTQRNGEVKKSGDLLNYNGDSNMVSAIQDII